MLAIIPTDDGSNTIFNSEVGENYHSRHGALQESRHVFLNSGLKYFMDRRMEIFSSPKAVSILEIGFGTGLNFLLSADHCAENNISLDYTGIEAYPLSMEMIGQTGYEAYVSPETWQQFLAHYTGSLHKSVNLNSICKLRTVHCKLADFRSNSQFDIIYFDAFASAYQPEMWDQAAISHTLQFLKPGGIFVTYAITGNLKRIIKSLGLKVEKVPGAQGKREMLRAVR